MYIGTVKIFGKYLAVKSHFFEFARLTLWLTLDSPMLYIHFFSELGGFCNYNSQTSEKKGKEKNVTHQSPQSQRLRKAKMRISKNYHEFIVSHKGNKDSNILSISSKFRVDLPLL